jgi:hypothetical protein
VLVNRITTVGTLRGSIPRRGIMSLSVALIGAVVVTLAHATGHYVFGDASTFEEAGVSQAGLLVFAATFLVLLVVV